jgi:amino acid transporter
MATTLIFPMQPSLPVFSSVLAIIVVSLVLLIESRGDYNTASFAFITVENESGWTDSFVPWAIGLSQSVLATTAYDTVVHYSEECADPGKIMPLAMLYGLGIDGIVTLVYAIVLIFTVGSDITTLADSPLGFPFAQVLLNRTGSVNGTIVILFWMMTIFIYAIIDVDMVSTVAALIGIPPFLHCSPRISLTPKAIARMIMIFARERGTPFPSVFEAVLPKFDTPKWAPFFALIVQSGVAWIFVVSKEESAATGFPIAYMTTLFLFCPTGKRGGIYIHHLESCFNL